MHARSYQHLRSGRSYLFSRDCLEVDLEVEGRPLTLFVNHFKSMLDKRDPANGRRNTRERRLLQARGVKEIVTERFGRRPGRRPFAILGDLNDYREDDEAGSSAIGELVDWEELEDVASRLPAEERWTHFFRKRSGPVRNSYHQLDYLLLSRSLARASSAAPELVRKGLPQRADRYTGARFPGVGLDAPAASDHCPVVIELEL